MKRVLQIIVFFGYLLSLFMPFSNALADELILPSDLEIIEDMAFYYDTSLDVVTIQEGTKAIRSKAFAYSGVKVINLPASLSFIAKDAFEGCNISCLNVERNTYAYNWALYYGYIGSPDEAGYTTLRLGSEGIAVENLVRELKNQGYYFGSITNNFNSAVEAAVRTFQVAMDLNVDGIAGNDTQHALFHTVPIGQGDHSNLTMDIYPAEKIDWYTGGIDVLWSRGSNFKVMDVQTGLVWWAHRWAGGLHVDAEPLTAADTAVICEMYGVDNADQILASTHWQRRPSLVTIGTRTFACSLYGVPHNPDGDTISDNNFTGQVCIFFTNSKTHDSRKVDGLHTEAIEYAWQNAPNGHK